MLRGYLTFDFGRSFFRDEPVLQLVEEKMPVSISLGLWSTLLVYFVSIPLGITKAVRDGSRFDVVSSAVVLIGYAVPGFLFAILLVVLFAGGSFVQWFPLRGLHSIGTETWSMPARIAGLFVAHGAADRGARGRWVCRPYRADQKLLSWRKSASNTSSPPAPKAPASSASFIATCSAMRCC